MPMRASDTAVIVGLGNIGGYSADLMVRSGLVRHLILIDRDTYEPGNLARQAIAAADVGVPKAIAQARRLRRVNPAVTVEAVVAAVESVPLGLLRAAVVLGGLDSRRARQVLFDACWHLGVPYVDGGVHADAMLARVSTFVPGTRSSCGVCAWDDDDYRLVEQEYSCAASAARPASTNAPSTLGALCAAYQVIEVCRVLRGDRSLAGSQLVIDASSRAQFVCSIARSPGCRFDHAVWQVEALGCDPRHTAILDLESALGGGRIRVSGQRFVRHLGCLECGRRRATWRLSQRLGAGRSCRHCDGALVPVVADDWLDLGRLAPALRRRPASALGLQTRDIVAVQRGGGVAYVELSATEE